MAEIQEEKLHTESTDAHSVCKKKSGKLGKIITSVVVFFVIVSLGKFLGRQAGRQAAMQTIEQESISQNAPIGFMGAKWLMPLSEAKALFPDAIEFAPGNLKYESTAFSRPAFIDLMFDDNLLIMIIITFKGEKTENTYNQTRKLIVQEYGVFPKPITTAEQKLISRKSIGRVAIEHVLYEQLGMSIEQIMLYRTKASASK